MSSRERQQGLDDLLEGSLDQIVMIDFTAAEHAQDGALDRGVEALVDGAGDTVIPASNRGDQLGVTQLGAFLLRRGRRRRAADAGRRRLGLGRLARSNDP